MKITSTLLSSLAVVGFCTAQNSTNSTFPKLQRFCKPVQTIEGGAVSGWIPQGTELPLHWKEQFGNETCQDGPMPFGMCNVGDIEGLGWYQTKESIQLGYASDLFKNGDGAAVGAHDIFLTATQGWVLTDVCSKLRGDANPAEELIVFRSVGTSYDDGDPNPDPARSISTTLYSLDAEQSPACDGYHISFSMRVNGYGGPHKAVGPGCDYETCRYKGEICQYVSGDDQVDGNREVQEVRPTLESSSADRLTLGAVAVVAAASLLIQ